MKTFNLNTMKKRKKEQEIEPIPFAPAIPMIPPDQNPAIEKPFPFEPSPEILPEIKPDLKPDKEQEI